MQNRVLSLLLASSSVYAASQCKHNQYNTPSGACDNCQFGSVPDANQIFCVPNGMCQFVTNQINMKDGSCLECSPCERPNITHDGCDKNPDYTTCMYKLTGQPVAPKAGTTCDPTKYLAPSGNCENCPSCETPDGTGVACNKVSWYNQCMTNLCDWKTQVTDTTGQCKTCPPCTVPNSALNDCTEKADFDTCMNNQCNWSTDFLKADGSCESCPVCQKPDFFKADCFKDGDYDGCMNNACNWQNQIIDVKGQCKDCDPCWKPNFDKNSCVQPADYNQCMTQACNWGVEVLINGKCTTCPACTEIVAGSKTTCTQKSKFDTCMSTACEWNSQYLDSDKKCAQCPTCEKANWQRTKCFQDADYVSCKGGINPGCGANEISTSWGCQACGSCQAPDLQKTQCLPIPGCGQPSAPVTCGPNEAIDAWGLSCVPVYQQQWQPPVPVWQPPTQPVCGYGQIQTASGCQSCAAGQNPDPTNSYCVYSATNNNPPVTTWTPPATQSFSPASCPSTSYKSYDGSCQACGQGTVQDYTGSGCAAVAAYNYNAYAMNFAEVQDQENAEGDA